MRNRQKATVYNLTTTMRIVFLAVSCFVFGVLSVNVPTWSTNSNTYKCNCVTGQCGGHSPCPDGQCSTWWFGPACQYQNLLNDNYTTGVNKKLYDGKDDTCVNVTDSLEITFKKSYLFTWLRFTVLEAGSNKDSLSLTFKNNTPDWTIPCNKLNPNVVNNRTTDVWCDMNQTTNALKLTWSKPITICSLYISGGRNLAFNQSTAQSSTYQENGRPLLAALAVDGNIDGVFQHNSCSHTSTYETYGAPYWNITLSGAYYINRCVLYNRWDSTEACEPKTWGISCNQSCNDRCMDNTCNRFNGDCDKGCKDAHQPPACTQACHETFYGTNCSQRCSPNCTNSLCHPVNGLCLSCKDGSYGDFCDHTCHETYYGNNCSQRCSSNCTNSLCHPVNGHCLSCNAGSDGDFCDQSCHDTYYGTNCSQRCNPNCTNSLCHPVNGYCFSCKDGSYGEFCDQTCDPYHYGNLCKLNCSINCFQSKCDSVNGQCERCYPGLTGKFCQNEKDQYDEKAEGIGIGVAIGVVVTSLLFLITAVLLHRMRIWSCGRNQKIKEEIYEHTPDPKLESEQHKIYTEAIENEEIDLQVKSSPYTNQNLHTYDVINLQDVEKSDYHVFNT